MYKLKTIVLFLASLLSLELTADNIEIEFQGGSCSYGGFTYNLEKLGSLSNGKSAYSQPGIAELNWNSLNARWELKIFTMLVGYNESDTDIDPPCFGASTWSILDSDCTLSVLSGSCDPLDCRLTITENSQSLCIDNENDDYFTLTINATAENGNDQYQVLIDGISIGNPTNYGNSITLGDGTNGAIGTFAADGISTYVLTVRDVSDGTCTDSYTTTAVSDCFTGPMAEYVIGREKGTVKTCSGTFADGGDLIGNYSNNRSDTLTFCSDVGNHISLSFKKFNLFGTGDTLFVYDGPSISSEPVAGSPFTVQDPSNGPGTVTSKGTCLTFLFKSNGSEVASGWEADILCSGEIIPGAVAENWQGYPYDESCGSSGQIGGTVYEDFNGNGKKDFSEPGIADKFVKIYSETGIVQSVTTNSDGDYTFNNLDLGKVYRVEFETDGVFQSGPMGSESNSTVQFVFTNKCNADLGIIDPSNYCAENNPEWLIPCFINGDALHASNVGETGIARFLYNDSGESPAPSYANKVNVDKIGTTHGLAYRASTGDVFVSTMLKRHTGLGPSGIGAIYQHHLDDNAETVNLFYDFGAAAGVVLPSAQRFPGGGNAFGQEGPCGSCDNVDPTTFPQIGKVGFGDIDLSANDSTLFVVNLFDRTVYQLNSFAPTANSATALPNQPWLDNSICTNGIARPWALKVKRNKLYVGLICDASNSGCALDLPCNDLTASVYEFDLDTENWSLKLSFPLTYLRKAYKNGSDNWVRWIDDYADMITKVYRITDAQLGQPIFTDIEIDVDGSLILGFGDRSGLQLGYQAPAPNKTSTDTGDRIFSFGDILRASYNSNTDSHTLENDGSVGGLNTTNSDTRSGPGGKSFYHGDYWFSGSSNAGIGSLALLPGSGEVMFPLGDPINPFSNGVAWISNTSGARTRTIEVYSGGTDRNGNPVPNPVTFAKASGVGDIELLCDGPAVEIGNHVWWDQNLNGIQDPNETGLENITLKLYKDLDGNTLDGSNLNGDEIHVATTTTDDYGRYVFSNSTNDNGLKPEIWETGHVEVLANMTYVVSIENFAQQTSIQEIASKFGYNNIQLSPEKNQNENGKSRDNNGRLSDTNALASIHVFHKNDHDLDFGFGSSSACLVSAAPSSNTTCYGDTLKLCANPLSGTPPYNFQWSGPNGFSSTNEKPLVPNVTVQNKGLYRLIITDANTCNDTLDINVNINGITSTISKTDADCALGNGTISVMASGAEPLEFDWEDIVGNDNEKNRSGLLSGTYSLTITDNDFCSAIHIINIENSNGPRFISSTLVHKKCGINNGSISLETSLATSFAWSHGPSTEDVYNLQAGTYTVTISDGSCDAERTFEITETPPILITESISHSTCQDKNGSIHINVTQGKKDYTYDWAHIEGDSDSKDISGLSGGTYAITVTDADGCTTSKFFEVKTSPEVSFSEIHNDPTCGDDNGTITISNIVGTAPYSIIWSVAPQSGDNELTRTSLAPGNYNVKVTDAHGCADSISISLNNVGSPSIDLDKIINETCSGSNGSINTRITGATSITWSTNADTEDINGLSAGTYYVTATNDVCPIVDSFKIVNAPSPTISLSITNSTCQEANGSIIINLTDGTKPFTYNWSHISGSDNAMNQSNLRAGTYSVTVTDANGCTDEATADLSTTPIVTLSDAHDNEACGESDGSIDLNVLTGTPPYTYQWDYDGTEDSGDPQDLENLDAGTYNVTVTDQSGCTASREVIIIDEGSPTAVVATSHNSDCNNPNGRIDLTVKGGKESYSFDWSNDGPESPDNDTEDLSGLSSGTYMVTITDANGCTTTANTTIHEADVALIKTLKSSDLTPTRFGDTVEFEITVRNQGTTTIGSMDIVDYGSDGLEFINDNQLGGINEDWNISDEGEARYSISQELGTGDDFKVSIHFKVKRIDIVNASEYINTAEISYAADLLGNEIHDCDSELNSNPNDNGGGMINSPADDHWDGDGTSAEKNGIDSTDQDNVDPAEICIFDLALDNKLSTEVELYEPGDTATFAVCVYNQANVAAQDISLSYFIPIGYTYLSSNNSKGWSYNVVNRKATMTINSGFNDGQKLNAKEKICVEIDLIVNRGNMISSDHITIAEITKATIVKSELINNSGTYETVSISTVAMNDADSDYDDNVQNDAGGCIATSSDNYLDGDGKGSSHDCDVNKDEDDHDPAKVTLSLHSIGNQVWHDIDNDGYRNGEETGLENVEINLYFINPITGDCELVATDTTNQKGMYLFSGLFAGKYITTVSANNFGSSRSLENYVSSNGGGLRSLHAGPFENINKPIDSDSDVDGDDNGLTSSSGKLNGAVISDTITLGIAEPTNESPSNESTIADDRSNLTIDFGFIEKTFDLALKKDFKYEDSTYVFGNVIEYEISLFNQGNIDAKDIIITDYIPDALTTIGISNPGWTITGDTIGTYTYSSELKSGDSTTIGFRAIFREGQNGGDYINCAEISGASDSNGNSSIKDKDSNPDYIKNNDAGGKPLTDADNFVWGDGSGQINSPSAFNDEDDSDPAVLGYVDLALKKLIINPSPVSIGEEVDFEITVYNQGSFSAKDIQIVDYIPQGVKWTNTNNDWTLRDDSTATFTINSELKPNDSISVKISLLISENIALDNSVNYAEIASFFFTDGREATDFDIDSKGDNNRNNDAGGLKNSANDNILTGIGTRGSGTPGDAIALTDEDDHDPACVPFMDLALRKTLKGITAPVKWEDTLSYIITIFNQGNEAATDLVIIDYVPKGLKFLKSNSPLWNLNEDGNPITEYSGILESGDSLDIEIDLEVNFGATADDLTNYSEVVSFKNLLGQIGKDIDSTPDDEENNDGEVSDDRTLNEDGDEDDHDIVKSPVFDLALRKVVSSGHTLVTQGDQVVYEIEIFNQGNVDATGIEIADYHQEGLTFLANQNPDWKVVGDHLEYIPTLSLNAGDSASIYLSLLVNENAANFNILNGAEIISARDKNFNTLNNSDIDSKPDAISDNDIGGLVGSATDNLINDIGIIDEDDHDRASITMTGDIACKGRINVSLDNACNLQLTPIMLLVDTLPFMSSDYDIDYFDLKGNPIDSLKINEVINVMISVPGSSNDQHICWSEVLVEDKLPPILHCPITDTITCFEMDSIKLPSVADLCHIGVNVEMVDQKMRSLCIGDTIIGMSQRTFRATDRAGNVSDTCSTSVYIKTPKISNITFPLDTTLSCNSSLNTTDALSKLNLGGPTFMGFDLTTDTLQNCFISATKKDQIILDIPCKKQIMRMWTIRQTLCSKGDTVIEHPQLITLTDTIAPIITLGDTIRVSGTADFNCQVTFSLPSLKVTDNCDDVVERKIFHDSLPTFYNGTTLRLPVDTHTIYVQAIDDCHNVSRDTAVIILRDETSPVALCLREFAVSLNKSGNVSVPATTFNDGSYDGCGKVTFAARRMTTACGDSTNFGTQVKFCCDDVGKEVMIAMRVTDENGNTSVCMINVEVQDKTTPSISCPPNLTVGCSFLFADLSIFGNVVEEGQQEALKISSSDVMSSSESLADGVFFGNCMDSVSTSDTRSLNNCGIGTINRTFIARASNGLSASCIQTITIAEDGTNPKPTIVYPRDTLIISCNTNSAVPDSTGRPMAMDSRCNMIAFTHKDQVINVQDTSLVCMKIIRKWTAFNTCITPEKIVGTGEQLILMHKTQSSNNLVINGKISTSENIPLLNASVSLMNEVEREILSNKTNVEGEYIFKDFGKSNGYIVKPYKNDDWLNGVSTLDLIHIQNHILGGKSFDNGYDMIAADVNKDQNISAIDLVLLRKLILGLDTEVKTNTSWRFVWSGDDVNSRMKLTSDLTESYDIQALDSPMHIEWKAIKVGDLTNNAVANQLIQSRSSDNQKHTLSWKSNRLKDGTEILFFLPEIRDFNGLQVELKFLNPINISGFGSGQIEINGSHVNALENGYGLKLSYNSLTTKEVNRDDPIFSIIIQSPLLDLSLNESEMKAEVYQGYSPIALNLKKMDDDFSDIEMTSEPNPWSESTDIHITTDLESDGTLRIYNIDGALLLSRKVELSRGKNVFRINKKDIATSGILIYELEKDGNTITQKMIKID